MQIQEIFNLAIERDFYNESDRFMCNSIEQLRNCGLITSCDCEAALREIKNYIGLNGTLSNQMFDVFKVHGRTWYDYSQHDRFVHCLNIYRDWDNRFSNQYPMKRIHIE